MGSESKTLGSDSRTFGSESETFGSESKTVGSESKTFGSESKTFGSESKTFGFRGSKHSRHKHRLPFRLQALKSMDSVMEAVLYDSDFAWTTYEGTRRGRYRRVKIAGIKHDGWYNLLPSWKVTYLVKRTIWKKASLEAEAVLIEEAFLGSPSSDGYGRVDLRVDIKGIGKGIYYHQLV